MIISIYQILPGPFMIILKYRLLPGPSTYNYLDLSIKYSQVPLLWSLCIKFKYSKVTSMFDNTPRSLNDNLNHILNTPRSSRCQDDMTWPMWVHVTKNTYLADRIINIFKHAITAFKCRRLSLSSNWPQRL